MKYEGIRQGKVNKDENVYVFAFGIKEMELLKVIIAHYHKNIPKTIETTPVVGRLRNWKKTIDDFYFKKRFD